MAPTLVASYLVTSAASDTTSLVTPSFTPAIGEIVVVKAIAADFHLSISTPTDSQSNAYTSRKTGPNSGSNVWAGLWTATTSAASSMTVTVAVSGTANWHSLLVERWSGASLAATPATNGTTSGTGAPSSTITTTAANSVVSWCDGDWNAVSP